VLPTIPVTPTIRATLGTVSISSQVPPARTCASSQLTQSSKFSAPHEPYYSEARKEEKNRECEWNSWQAIHQLLYLEDQHVATLLLGD
jgi:hypothetical protein